MPKRTVTAKDIYGNYHQAEVASLRWRPSVYGVVIKNGAVLTFRAFGGYALAGGGIELGETIEQALLREIKEETGITVSVGELLGAGGSFFVLPGKAKEKEYVQSLLLYYRCSYISGEINDEGLEEEEKEYGGSPEWLPLERLDGITLASSVDWRVHVRKAMK